MKNIIIAIVAAVAFTTTAQAAAIGWSVALGSTDYNGNAYSIFVIGQNGVTDVAQITALLDAGKDVSGYAFGGGTITAATTTIQANASGKSIVPDSFPATLTSFAVVFDSASPTAGSSKYLAISGQSGQTRELKTSASGSATFATGNVSSLAANSSNWKSFGPVPEPTTVALLALGLAALGLKRKVA